MERERYEIHSYRRFRLLGRNVVSLLGTRGHEVVPLYGRNQVDGGVRLDLLDFSAVEKFLDGEVGVDVVVHAAACCNVADVSADPERARRVNVDASINLGKLCSSRGIHFIFISTNYVFDGKTPPYAPNSPTGPVNDYGRQKVDTERALIKLKTVSILRIPLQYGNHFHLKPSSRAILDAVRKAREEVIQVDNDQIRTPTYVMNTAHIIEQIGVNKLTGMFNYCDGLQVTRFQFAQMVAKALGLG